MEKALRYLNQPLSDDDEVDAKCGEWQEPNAGQVPEYFKHRRPAPHPELLAIFFKELETFLGVPFELVDRNQGLYSYGQKKLYIVFLDNNVMVRVGGGFVPIAEFVARAESDELRKRYKNSMPHHLLEELVSRQQMISTKGFEQIYSKIGLNVGNSMPLHKKLWSHQRKRGEPTLDRQTVSKKKYKDLLSSHKRASEDWRQERKRLSQQILQLRASVSRHNQDIQELRQENSHLREEQTLLLERCQRDQDDKLQAQLSLKRSQQQHSKDRAEWENVYERLTQELMIYSASPNQFSDTVKSDLQNTPNRVLSDEKQSPTSLPFDNIAKIPAPTASSAGSVSNQDWWRNRFQNEVRRRIQGEDVHQSVLNQLKASLATAQAMKQDLQQQLQQLRADHATMKDTHAKKEACLSLQLVTKEEEIRCLNESVQERLATLSEERNALDIRKAEFDHYLVEMKGREKRIRKDQSVLEQDRHQLTDAQLHLLEMQQECAKKLAHQETHLNEHRQKAEEFHVKLSHLEQEKFKLLSEVELIKADRRRLNLEQKQIQKEQAAWQKEQQDRHLLREQWKEESRQIEHERQKFADEQNHQQRQRQEWELENTQNKADRASWAKEEAQQKKNEDKQKAELLECEEEIQALKQEKVKLKQQIVDMETVFDEMQQELHKLEEKFQSAQNAYDSAPAKREQTETPAIDTQPLQEQYENNLNPEVKAIQSDSNRDHVCQALIRHDDTELANNASLQLHQRSLVSSSSSTFSYAYPNTPANSSALASPYRLSPSFSSHLPSRSPIPSTNLLPSTATIPCPLNSPSVSSMLTSPPTLGSTAKLVPSSSFGLGYTDTNKFYHPSHPTRVGQNTSPVRNASSRMLSNSTGSPKPRPMRLQQNDSSPIPVALDLKIAFDDLHDDLDTDGTDTTTHSNRQMASKEHVDKSNEEDDSVLGHSSTDLEQKEQETISNLHAQIEQFQIERNNWEKEQECWERERECWKKERENWGTEEESRKSLMEEQKKAWIEKHEQELQRRIEEVIALQNDKTSLIVSHQQEQGHMQKILEATEQECQRKIQALQQEIQDLKEKVLSCQHSLNISEEEHHAMNLVHSELKSDLTKMTEKANSLQEVLQAREENASLRSLQTELERARMKNEDLRSQMQTCLSPSLKPMFTLSYNLKQMKDELSRTEEERDALQETVSSLHQAYEAADVPIPQTLLTPVRPSHKRRTVKPSLDTKNPQSPITAPPPPQSILASESAEQMLESIKKVRQELCQAQVEHQQSLDQMRSEYEKKLQKFADHHYKEKNTRMKEWEEEKNQLLSLMQEHKGQHESQLSVAAKSISNRSPSVASRETSPPTRIPLHLRDYSKKTCDQHVVGKKKAYSPSTPDAPSRAVQRLVTQSVLSRVPNNQQISDWTNLQQVNEKLAEQVERLNERSSTLKKKLNQSNMRNKIHRKTIKSLEEQLHAQTVKGRDLTAKTMEVEKSLVEIKAKKKKLTADRDSLTQSIYRLNQSKQELKQREDRLKVEKSAVAIEAARLKNFEANRKQREWRTSERDKIVSEREANIDSLLEKEKRQVDDLQKVVNEQRESIAHLTTQLEKTDVQLSQWKARARALKVDKDLSRKQSKEGKSMVGTDTSQSEDVGTRLSKSPTKRYMLGKLVAKETRDLMETLSDLDKKHKVLLVANRKLRTETENQTQEIEYLNNQVRVQEEELESLKKQREIQDQELKRLNSTALLSTNHVLQETLDQKTDECQELQKSEETMLQELEESATLEAQLLENIRDLKFHNSKLTDENSKLKLKVTKYKNRARKEMKVSKVREKKLSEFYRYHRSFRASAAALKGETDRLRSERRRGKSESPHSEEHDVLMDLDETVYQYTSPTTNRKRKLRQRSSQKAADSSESNSVRESRSARKPALYPTKITSNDRIITTQTRNTNGQFERGTLVSPSAQARKKRLRELKQRNRRFQQELGQASELQDADEKNSLAKGQEELEKKNANTLEGMKGTDSSDDKTNDAMSEICLRSPVDPDNLKHKERESVDNCITGSTSRENTGNHVATVSSVFSLPSDAEANGNSSAKEIARDTKEQQPADSHPLSNLVPSAEGNKEACQIPEWKQLPRISTLVSSEKLFRGDPEDDTQINSQGCQEDLNHGADASHESNLQQQEDFVTSSSEAGDIINDDGQCDFTTEHGVGSESDADIHEMDEEERQLMLETEELERLLKLEEEQLAELEAENLGPDELEDNCLKPRQFGGQK